MTEGNGGVTYTVKELLGNLDRKLDSIVDKLESKVDMRQFELLITRVAALEEKATNVEVARHTAEQVASTLKAKIEADRTTWDRLRSKVAWTLGTLLAVLSIYSSFVPHPF